MYVSHSTQATCSMGQVVEHTLISSVIPVLVTLLCYCTVMLTVPGVLRAVWIQAPISLMTAVTTPMPVIFVNPSPVHLTTVSGTLIPESLGSTALAVSHIAEALTTASTSSSSYWVYA